jgi:hypothetical protein
MLRLLFLGVMGALLLLVNCSVNAQDAGQRAQDLAASLDKNKYKKKEKRNFAFEFYIDVKNEPAARTSASEYSGLYHADDYQLELRVSGSGAAEGSGYERVMQNGRRATFTLRDARVEGTLLTAVKVYDGGETRPFEAVFVNRTVVQGKNAETIETRETMFGIGYIESGSGGGGSSDGSWTNRVLLEKR